tara:strand:- start:220 stop:705 length:486 start_codon:yes stop_codon:yes gene_type:complete
MITKMKKFLFIYAILIFFNCEDNISDKIPAFEARLNGDFEWSAETFSATFQNNQLSIVGNNPFGIISIYLDSAVVGTHNIYSWTDDFLIFQDTIQYSTKNDGVASIAFLSDGQIDISEIDDINNTVSGHFHFDAYNSSGDYTVNISEGVFYKIPISSDNQD